MWRMAGLMTMQQQERGGGAEGAGPDVGTILIRKSGRGEGFDALLQQATNKRRQYNKNKNTNKSRRRRIGMHVSTAEPGLALPSPSSSVPRSSPARFVSHSHAANMHEVSAQPQKGFSIS